MKIPRRLNWRRCRSPGHRTAVVEQLHETFVHRAILAKYPHIYRAAQERRNKVKHLSHPALDSSMAATLTMTAPSNRSTSDDHPGPRHPSHPRISTDSLREP